MTSFDEDWCDNVSINKQEQEHTCGLETEHDGAHRCFACGEEW